ncbi:MAG: peptidase T [Proteobacteria bacterium]|nr:peptidase T [Pseudomonadota bacterium]
MTYNYKVDRDYLLDAFIRYVKVDTTAKEDVTSVPSSPGQMELGKMIAADFKKLGITDVEQDKHGYVVARVKGNVKAPAIGFIAHLDTSHECVADKVNPIIHKNYKTSDIKLPKNSLVIKVSDFPELKEKEGKTIITTDGSTLLGGDDKCGVAINMEVAKFLVNDKDFKHGDVLFIFTPDEEIGHGAELLDIKKLNAAAAYTLDGEGHAMMCEETFSADQMICHFTGRDIHPGQAKDKMINSIRIASRFIEKHPLNERPETTEKRDGFIHPVKIDGGTKETKLTCIIRDFSTEKLKDRVERMKTLAQTVAKEFKGEVRIEIKEQYRNMKLELDKDPRVVGYIKDAFEMTGIKPVFGLARGGTDGSRLSYRGLLTPDLAIGCYGVHSNGEWVVLEEMEETAQIVRNLIRRWGEN